MSFAVRAQDQINFVDAPTTVDGVSGPIAVEIRYSSTAVLDIITVFGENFGAQREIVRKRVIVPNSNGLETTVVVNLDLPPTWEPDCTGTEYEFDVFIVPNGGTFPIGGPTGPGRFRRGGIDFNTSAIVSFPAQVVPGSTVLIGVKHNLTPTQNITVEFRENAAGMTNYGTATTPNNFGCATANVPITIDANTPIGANYLVDASTFLSATNNNPERSTSRDIAQPIEVVAALPVELIAFYHEIEAEGVRLNWQTATELNNDYFLVEHSTDGIEFSELGTLPGAGTTDRSVDYGYLHADPTAGTNYYRLTQVDYDGTKETFETVAVELRRPTDEFPPVAVFPNPVEQTLHLQAPSGDLTGVRLFDNFGKQIGLDGSATRAVQQGRLDVSFLPAGWYTLQLIYAEGHRSEPVSFVKR